MQPSIGRIVLYCFRDRNTDKLVERPAIVTSTKEMFVNLHVFFEPDDSDACARGCSGNYPDFDPRYEAIEANHAGELPIANTWRWPPRV